MREEDEILKLLRRALETKQEESNDNITSLVGLLQKTMTKEVKEQTEVILLRKDVIEILDILKGPDGLLQRVKKLETLSWRLMGAFGCAILVAKFMKFI